MGFLSRLFARRPEAKSLTINTLGGLPVNWQNPEAVPAHQNSAVMACVKFASRAFPEAPLVVERLNGDVWEQQRKHGLSALVARPNPYYSGSLLWSGTLLSLMVDGNAYWLKLRGANGRGAVRELWYLPHFSVTPKCEAGAAYVSHYEYRAKGQLFRLAPEDVVHFRDGIDPDNPMLGLAPLKSVAREILTDNEIAQYSHSILKNMGVVGVLITPKDSQSVFEEGHAELIKQRFSATTTGNLRGEPLVLDAPLDVQSPGWSPKDISIDVLRQVPEARICAVLGIHPTVVGLSVGLEHSTFANMREAREMAYESFIIPMQSLCADALGTQHLPDLGDEDAERCRFDTSQVRVLQEDENSKAARLGQAYQFGGIKRSEYRAALGYDSTPDDELYYTDLQFAGGKALSQAEVVKQLRDRASQRQAVYNSLEEEDDVRDA